MTNLGDPLMTTAQVAEYLGVNPRTIRLWVEKRRNLPIVKVGNAVRFMPADVAAFRERQTRPPVGETVGASENHAQPLASTNCDLDGKNVQ